MERDRFSLFLNSMAKTMNWRLWFKDILAFLGLVWVARWVLYIVLDVVAALRKFVWARLSNDNLAIKYGGKWAVVTGCTDGIGKEYARQLAQRGMNILLIARNISKLNDVSQLIKEESPGVETGIIQVDFSHGRDVYPKIAAHLTDKDVGILVNNVGVSLYPPKKFMDASEEDIWNHVNINVASVVAMTRLVLAKMVARGRGAIINIASVASSCPGPYLGIYSASKVFVDFFSESLSVECGRTGITVQTIRPSYISTNMTNFSHYTSNTNWLVPSATTFVSSALPTLGHAGRTTGFWPHGIQAFVVDHIFPRWLTMWMVDLWHCVILKKSNKQQ